MPERERERERSGVIRRPSGSGRVLVVDDLLANVELLEEILCGEGYLVSRAMDGLEALEAVKKAPPDCIVLDVMMPRLDGFSVCSRLKSVRPTCFIPIVILTALSDVADKVQGLLVGADDFLNKPVHAIELLTRVKTLIRIKKLREELESSENVITTMAQALESKDKGSTGHALRTAVAALGAARSLAFPPDVIEAVGLAAMLHDLGKIGLPENLLDRAARSAADEEVFRRHPELGERILDPLVSFRAVREIVRHHHERLDGSGYPDGLSGKDFGPGAEIVAIANAYEDLSRDGADAADALRREAAAGKFHADHVAAVLAHATDATPPAGVWEKLLPPPHVSLIGRILLGDDNLGERSALEGALREEGHLVTRVESGDALLQAAAAVPPDLVVVGLHRTRPDTFEVCAQLKERASGFFPVILVTEPGALQDRARAAEVGADDILLQPVHRLELVTRVKSLLRVRVYFRDLEEHQSAVLALAAALEAKDPYTRGHSERVGALAARLGKEIGLDDEICERLRIAGLLHDIGKIGVPERLLNKSSSLTEEEFQTILTHPRHGETICRPLRSLQAVLPLIRHHHERWDGRGYPDHLKGDAIPVDARVLAMADAYDALTSDRSYRKRLGVEEALLILARETDSGFWDPRVGSALASLVRRELA